MSKTKIETTFTPQMLKKDILREARSIGLPTGFAGAIADQVAAEMDQYLRDRPVITQKDFDQKTATLIAKYHKDLAYLYKNRGKII